MDVNIARLIETVILICAIWALFFLSAFLHELGHAIAYRIATGGRDGHIRVGSGQFLLNTKRLTVKLLPYDGCFTPPEESRIDTAAKRIATLAGGPAVSLILVVLLLVLKFGGISLDSEVITASAIDTLITCALSINAFTLVMSLLPTHYFHGEIKGMETDGLQIIRAVRERGNKS